MATNTTRRKKTGSGNIKIQTGIERKLLDSKIMGKKKSRLPQIVAGAVVAGFLTGAVVLVYSRTANDHKTSGNYPEIEIPESKDGTLPVLNATSTLTTTEPVQKQYVRISDTPTGSLNVRTGPGTNYSKIGQVSPGEELEVVQYDDAAGWYEIKLEGGTGWVTKQYVQIK